MSIIIVFSILSIINSAVAREHLVQLREPEHTGPGEIPVTVAIAVAIVCNVVIVVVAIIIAIRGTL